MQIRRRSSMLSVMGLFLIAAQMASADVPPLRPGRGMATPAARDYAQTVSADCKKTEEKFAPASAGPENYIGVLLVSDNSSHVCFTPCDAGHTRC